MTSDTDDGDLTRWVVVQCFLKARVEHVLELRPDHMLVVQLPRSLLESPLIEAGAVVVYCLLE